MILQPTDTAAGGGQGPSKVAPRWFRWPQVADKVTLSLQVSGHLSTSPPPAPPPAHETRTQVVQTSQKLNKYLVYIKVTVYK